MDKMVPSFGPCSRGSWWVALLFAVPVLCSAPVSTLAATPTNTPTPTPTPTPTSTFTPTATPPSCIGETLSVDPVTSPTDLLAQTVTGCRRPSFGSPASGDSVTVTSEAGSFAATLQSGGCGFNTVKFAANVDLLSNEVNYLEVCVHYLYCPTVRCTTLDSSGNPLTIIQGQPPAPIRVSGEKLLVKDKDGEASKRKLVAISKDPNVAPPPDGDANAPTSRGAQLTLKNPDTGEMATFSLPAGSWSGLGKPPGTKGYKYTSAGVCQTVLIKPGLLKAVCKGDQIAFSLDESSQGSLGVTFTSGSNQHCMLFGETIKKDVPALLGKTGQFKATGAPPPDACP